VIDTNLVKTKLIEALGLEDMTPDDIEDNAPLFKEGLGLDSVDAIEITVLLNNEFGIEIKNMQEAEGAFDSVKALTEYINAHKK
jgi:acyl carrier protein